MKLTMSQALVQFLKNQFVERDSIKNAFFNGVWGYGHGELGEDVYKIKHGDMLQITDSRVHSQTAAPGFHMYYLWTIRHPNENPYDGFTYIKPFEKLLD